MRDMFSHNVTTVTQWKLATLPNFFTKFEMRYGRFVDEGEEVDPNYDPMCATLSEGCYPALVIDPQKLVHSEYGPAEARKLAELVQGSKGFDDWMIEEDVRFIVAMKLSIIVIMLRKDHMVRALPSLTKNVSHHYLKCVHFIGVGVYMA